MEPIRQPASSAWRTELPLRARRSVPGLSKKQYTGDKLESVSSFCLHNGGFVGFSNTSSRKKEFVIMDLDLKVVKKFQQPDLFWNISWTGEHLLCGSSRGVVYYYRLSNISKIDSKQAPTQKFYHENLEHVQYTPQPRKMPSNSRVYGVYINPNETSQFLTLENLNFHMWDLNKSEPFLSRKVSNSPNFAAEWSPYSSNEFLIGGLTGSLKLLDTRVYGGNMMVWKQNNAHRGSIRDISWSPLVPYWIASAGEDSSINVWDLRYGAAPMVMLEDHQNSVNKVSWSPYNAEVLISGGSDREFKIWGLHVYPHYLLASISDFSSSVIGVDFSPRLHQCLGVSNKGEITSVTLQRDFMEPLVRTRFKDSKEEKDVELSVYMKDFEMAADRIAEMSSKSMAGNRVKNLFKLVEMFEPLPEMSNSWKQSPPANIDPLDVFDRDLDLFSYRIPPFFDMSSVTLPRPAAKEKIRVLKMNGELLASAEKKDYSFFLEQQGTILETLKKDVNNLQLGVVIKIIQIFLSYDYIKALDIGMNMLVFYRNQGDTEGFTSISHMLLYPTIFCKHTADDSHPLSESEQFLSVFKDRERITQEVLFMKKFFTLLFSGKDIDQLCETHTKTILSTTATLIYINSLLQKQQYDTFFFYTSNILKQIKGTPFYNVVDELMKVYAFERLQSLIQSCLLIESKRSGANPNPSKYFDPIKITVNILQNGRGLPQYLLDYLSKNLSKVNANLKTVLSFLKKTNPASAKQESTKLYNEMAKYCDPTKIQPQYEPQISELFDILRNAKKD